MNSDSRAEPNVAVLILDTLRADLASSKEELPQTPSLKRIFRESILFTRAYAPSHWTLPSHGSLFTGLPPHMHGATSIPPMRLRSDTPTLAEVFRAQGYRTGVVSCNPWISPAFGMTRGFDVAKLYSPRVREVLRAARDRILALGHERYPNVRKVFDWFNRWSAVIHANPKGDNGARVALQDASAFIRNNGHPLFLALNLMEAHHPYYARGRFRDWRERIARAELFSDWSALTFAILARRTSMTASLQRAMRDLYWENVRYLDSQVGSFYGMLDDKFLNSSYLIILSDHGQFLGEQGLVDHVTGLYEEAIRVPLAIRPPGGASGDIQDFPVDIASLFPLLVTIAKGTDQDPVSIWLKWVKKRGPVISQAQGGIVPHVHRPKEGNPTFNRDLLTFKRRYDHPAVAVVRDSWKLVCHLGRDEDEIYNLTESGGERANLIRERPDIAAQLHDSIAEASKSNWGHVSGLHHAK